MGIPRAFVGRARRIPSQHRPRLPSREPHQVTLRPAIGQPVMRERVPQLVRVQIR